MAAAELALIIGIIGNVTSVMVYASPIPTFWYIYKKKSTEYFSALPYVCTLLTVLMGLYYGCIKENGMLIITINVIGLMFEAAYLTIFFIYATKFSRVRTIKQVLVDLVVFGAAVLLTLFLTRGKVRVLIVGSLCSTVAVSMYAAPLSIMRLVIRTKNVDFMPVTLSAFLTINGSLWSAYSFFARDIFIGIPSVLGSVLSLAQVVLYLIYRNAGKHAPASKQAAEEDESCHRIDMVFKEGQAQQVQLAEVDPAEAHKCHKTGKVADVSQGNPPQQQQQQRQRLQQSEEDTSTPGEANV